MNYAMLLARVRRLVLPVIAFTEQPANVATFGSTATFAATAITQTDADVQYQWQVSNDSGTTWSTLSGETSSSLSLFGLTTADSGKLYRVIASAAGAAQKTSQAAILTVATTPTAPSSVGVQSRENELEVTLAGGQDGGSAITSTRIEASSDGGATWLGVTFSGAPGSAYVEVPSSAAWLIRVARVNAGGVGAYATAATAVAKSRVSLTATPAGSFAFGASFSLSPYPAAGSPDYLFAWSSGDDGANSVTVTASRYCRLYLVQRGGSDDWIAYNDQWLFTGPGAAIPTNVLPQYFGGGSGSSFLSATFSPQGNNIAFSMEPEDEPKAPGVLTVAVS